MSIERLEEIIKQVKRSDEYAEKGLWEASDGMIIHLHNEGHINYLTERVQELKRLMDYQQKYGQKQLDEAVDAFRYYKGKSKSYRETLEFYANPRNYDLSAEAERAGLEFINVVDKDSGEKARKALGGE